MYANVIYLLAGIISSDDQYHKTMTTILFNTHNHGSLSKQINQLTDFDIRRVVYAALVLLGDQGYVYEIVQRKWKDGWNHHLTIHWDKHD